MTKISTRYRMWLCSATLKDNQHQKVNEKNVKILYSQLISISIEWVQVSSFTLSSKLKLSSFSSFLPASRDILSFLPARKEILSLDREFFYLFPASRDILSFLPARRDILCFLPARKEIRSLERENFYLSSMWYNTFYLSSLWENNFIFARREFLSTRA